MQYKYTVENLNFAVLKYRGLFSRSISLNNFCGFGQVPRNLRYVQARVFTTPTSQTVNEIVRRQLNFIFVEKLSQMARYLRKQQKLNPSKFKYYTV